MQVLKPDVYFSNLLQASYLKQNGIASLSSELCDPLGDVFVSVASSLHLLSQAGSNSAPTGGHRGNRWREQVGAAMDTAQRSCAQPTWSHFLLSQCACV